MAPLARLWLWRLAAWGLGLAPAVQLAWRFVHAQLTANPVEFIEHHTGLWALRLLLVTLAMTPLRQLTGAAEAIRVRRLLGLWAFFWLCAHFGIYLVLDLELSLTQLAQDVVKRSYITAGFIGWFLLLPLALTSTQGWQRRLKRHWKTLHRLIYPATLAGALHFLWLVKADHREPALYLAVLLALLASRAGWRRALDILRPRSLPRPAP